ncbi:MAG: hypothetical protein KBI44_10715 [Thermoanaerobaculia bacterium]|jgi:hypothetical protein|nr:hypothetical protein [Thermoanaerobaculia bacterium]
MPIRALLRRALFAAATFATSAVGATAASAQGVVQNPEFDVAAVGPWTGNIASLTWSPTDPDCLPPDASGSLQVSPDNPQGPATAFLCVAPPPAGTWNLAFLVRAECQEVVKGILRYYPEVNCGGAVIGSEETGGTTLGGTWDQAELAGAAPPVGTLSVWIGLELSESLTSICTTLFDRIHFGRGIPILRSGFETGSTACRWSATVP